MPGQDAETADVAAVTIPPEMPKGLLKRGRGLWDEKAQVLAGHPLGLIVLAELCRTVDRCERLDAQLRGRDKEWLRVDLDPQSIRTRNGDDGVTVVDVTAKVVMNAPLREARQQQTVLKQLAAQVDAFERAAVDAVAGRASSPEAAPGVPSLLDKIRARNA
ncbi:MAG: hypothetical protein U5O16_40985 [Rhodococcus sp. (in: high G+C Gram-positive bacteria)]|uniref:hypothetical protein n=1 Tax=Rhodococcus sp. TaxID=1831 RepID=UPI002AD6CDC5|nr:hypothetical protein [Rhodococcus sp. (in: high G+C Gram-positive bacteria)]